MRVESLKIGLHTLTVSFPEVVFIGDKAVYGKTDIDALSIAISSIAPRSMQVELLIHEILHACYYFAYLWKQKNVQEEDTVSRLAFFFASILFDNPWVIQFVQEEC